MTRYRGMIERTVPLIGKRWANEWFPLIKERNEAERDVDYSTMSDEEIFARYHEMTRWMEQMWYIHGHINFALISGAALSDFYDEVMHPDDPTEAYQILQGYHTRPVDAAHGLWDLSRKVKASPALTKIFDENPPRELQRALGQSEEGRAFLADLDAYLYDFGWRSDAVYDLNDVPWIENPAIPLGNIARYVPMGDEDDPMIGFNRALEGAIDLKRNEYEALHDCLSAPCPKYEPSNQFVVDHIGDHSNGFEDLGIEYYRFVPGKDNAGMTDKRQAAGQTHRGKSRVN